MTRRSAIAVLFCCACWAVSAQAGRSKPAAAPTLADLSQRAAPLQRDEVAAVDSEQAARSYEDFLKVDGADPAMRAQALRRVGDLRLAAAEAQRARDGGSAEQAAAATREAIATYKQLLREFPDYPGTDAVLYQLARAFEAIGDSADAAATLDRLVEQFPNTSHYAEAQFRRGESLFSSQRYADAERAYAAVLAHGQDSEFREQALYKRAWALFKQARNEESSASFLDLLDRLLVADGKLRPAAELSRPEQELSEDTLRALSIMFAASDGAESLQAALAGRRGAPYESRLYRALGDLYVDKERYQDGAGAYRAFAKRRPLDPEAPLMLGSAAEAYSKGGFTSLVLEAKSELVEQYGPNSAYWHAHPTDIDPRVSAAVQANLLDLARHYHALAQKSGAAADRALAVRWYREYLTGFDGSPQAPATRLLLADLLFEGGQFGEAATEYEAAAYSYANAPEAGRAGYAALVAFDKAEAQLPESERPALRLRAIDSSLRFTSTFPQHPETPAVLTRTTKALFDLGDRTRAEALAQQVLDLGSRADAGQQVVAWTVLAHTYFDSARYAEAERAYGEVASRLPANDPLLPEITERRAASVYRQAEAKQAAGDLPGAVQDFLRVASVAPTSPAGPKAEFDAATLLLTAKRWDQAAGVLEGFRRDHPQHELQPEVTRKLAVAYLEGGHQREAATELERVAAREGEDAEVRRAALWQAAELYAASGDASAASRAYAEYVKRFPAPLGPAVEARQELAELALKAGDDAGRRQWLQEIVAADAAAGAERTERSRFLAAGASLELARPLDAAAREIRLVIPLDKSLAAKRKAMEAALTAYGNAEGYGIAQVTTAATFAMADLYRHLGRSLLESDRPRGLSSEELEQYELLLEEQAFPFEEKAIGIHERNARRAASGVYDEWVQKSYAALASMKPARYARQEVAEGPDASPTAAPEMTQQFAAARTALEEGRDDDARRLFETALAADPRNAVALNRLGVADRRLGRFADARAAYERAIAADPSFADAERNLAIVVDLYLGDAPAALAHYERYQALTSGADTEVSAWLVELRTRLGQVPRTAEAKP